MRVRTIVSGDWTTVVETWRAETTGVNGVVYTGIFIWHPRLIIIRPIALYRTNPYGYLYRFSDGSKFHHQKQFPPCSKPF